MQRGTTLTPLRPPPDLYHALTWPQLSFVAEDHKGRIVGYILAKMYVPFPAQNGSTGSENRGRERKLTFCSAQGRGAL